MVNRNKIIGRRIKILREKMQFTQVEFAKMLGLKSSGIISQVENGERGLKGSNMAKAAEIFGVEEIALNASLDLSYDSVSMVTEFIRLLKKKKRNRKEENTLKIIKLTLSNHI